MLEAATAASMLDLQSRLRASADQVHRRVGDTVTALNVRTGRYFTMNSTAGVMLAAVGDAPSIGAAAEQMAARYEADPARIEQDLLGLCRGLVERGLLVVADDEPAEADAA